VAVAAAAAFVAVASAGLSGNGSLTMASGFTLYAYDYSVQFNQPVSYFWVQFKRHPGRTITTVNGPPGFSCVVYEGPPPYFLCGLRHRNGPAGRTAANQVLTGMVYVNEPIAPGEGASLYKVREGTAGRRFGPFPITGP
jgi:hypothetical protein